MLDATALGGAATRIEVRLLFGHGGQPSMDLLLYLPNRRTQPAPLFLGLNFHGNHAIHPDPTITVSSQWMPVRKPTAYVANRATEASRGVEASRWPVEEIIARGYGLATVYYGDLDPDFDDGFHNGVHPLFSDAGHRNKQEQPGEPLAHGRGASAVRWITSSRIHRSIIRALR